MVLWLLFLVGCAASGGRQAVPQSASSFDVLVVEFVTIGASLSDEQKAACYDLKSGALIYRVAVDGRLEYWHTGGELPSVAQTRFGDPEVGDCFLHEGKYYRVVGTVSLSSL
jgi:hypothetical protein